MHHLIFLAGLFFVAGMAASFDSFFRLDGVYIATNSMTCDASYVLGGYAVPLSSEGLSLKIHDLIPIAQSVSYVAIWNKTTSCVQILQDTGSGLVEVPAMTDLHTLVVKLLVFGE